ncbi:hypothetical protein J6590_063227 [Homalodisca vitripennis]|nr:hypothetical protein J6590_063227 [Homalodisca vitripennis]
MQEGAGRATELGDRTVAHEHTRVPFVNNLPNSVKSARMLKALKNSSENCIDCKSILQHRRSSWLINGRPQNWQTDQVLKWDNSNSISTVQHQEAGMLKPALVARGITVSPM